MSDRFIRTRMLIGDAGMERLNRSRVAVIGTGIAAQFAAEAFVRSGIGEIALYGEVDTERLKDINSDVKLTVFPIDAVLEKYDKTVNIQILKKSEDMPSYELARAAIEAAGDAVREIVKDVI